jgi:hypothetical protein
MSQVDPRLLGILYGTFREDLELLGTRKARLPFISTSMGIAGVTPSAKLWELLATPKLSKSRDALARRADRDATAVMRVTHPHMSTDWQSRQAPRKSK